ncbi:MAG: MFS transporter [Candidatus Lambdaproteobacteria bacterium]|nr:MFS transporter [Candidatus Lambdaproteobacteria bacterium]
MQPQAPATAGPPLWGLCGVGFLARASYGLARTPVLALFAAALGAGPEAIGLAVAMSTVTGIFFKLPAGMVSDVIGRTRTLLLGLAVFAFVPLAYLWVSSFQALLAVRFLHGFATAIFGPVSMAVVVETAGTRRGEALSWFSSLTIIGNLISAPLGGYLITTLSGGGEQRIAHFHVIYGVVAALGMASLLLALWVLRTRPGGADSAPGDSLAGRWARFGVGVREILLDRRVLLTSNMEGVQNLSVGALEAFLPVYVVLVAGLTAFQAGLLWGVQVAVTIAAKPLLGARSDRTGRQPMLFWGMFACAIPFALIPWFTAFPVLLGLAAVFGLGEALVTSSAAALVADLCDAGHLGSAMGAFGTIYDVGHASGPLLAGVLIGLSGDQDYRAAFAAISLLLLLAALAFRLGVRMPVPTQP